MINDITYIILIINIYILVYLYIYILYIYMHGIIVIKTVNTKAPLVSSRQFIATWLLVWDKKTFPAIGLEVLMGCHIPRR